MALPSTMIGHPTPYPTQRPPAARTCNRITPHGTSAPLPALHRDAPPSYYTTPAVSNFDFTAPVAQFLLHIDVGPRALCLIADSRNFEMSSWKRNFRDAGLSHAHTEELYGLLVVGLTDEQRGVLSAADTSIDTESSVTDDEV